MAVLGAGRYGCCGLVSVRRRFRRWWHGTVLPYRHLGGLAEAFGFATGLLVAAVNFRVTMKILLGASEPQCPR